MLALVYGVLALASIILFSSGNFVYFLLISAGSLVIYILESEGKINKGVHSILVRYFLACAIFVLIPAIFIVIFRRRLWSASKDGRWDYLTNFLVTVGPYISSKMGTNLSMQCMRTQSFEC